GTELLAHLLHPDLFPWKGPTAAFRAVTLPCLADGSDLRYGSLRGRQVIGVAFPISPDAPAFQLEQIARWGEEQARRSGDVRHCDLAQRLRSEAAARASNGA